MEYKECHVCHRQLPLSSFDRNVCCRDGHHSECRECRHRKYMAKNPHRKKRLVCYPDDELVNELVRRGTVYGLLHEIDRNDIRRFLEMPEKTSETSAGQADNLN